MSTLIVKYCEKRLFSLEEAIDYCGTASQFYDMACAGLIKPDRYAGKSRCIFSKDRLDKAIDRWLVGAELPQAGPKEIKAITNQWREAG